METKLAFVLSVIVLYFSDSTSGFLKPVDKFGYLGASLIELSWFSTPLSSRPSCRDDHGNPVDWFYASKLPRTNAAKSVKVKHKKLSPHHDGLSYLYMLSSEPISKNWTLSTKKANDPESMFGWTLSDIYKDKRNESLNYVLYNDEPPNGAINWSTKQGHLKGVLVFDNDSNGFWMTHSVPKYPSPSNGTYNYPDTGTNYGQSFFCISFHSSSSAFDDIGSQFKYTYPRVYDYHLQDWVKNSMPQLWTFIENSDIVSTPPWYQIKHLKSKEGTTFTHFAKHVLFNKANANNSKFEIDLYADLVAPELETNLWVESWQHQHDVIPSSCRRKYDVENVQTVSFINLHYSYKNGQDHSKWAVSSSGNQSISVTPWLCSGDINRTKSQFKRGGGTTCLSSVRIHRAFDGIIDTIEKCKIN